MCVPKPHDTIEHKWKVTTLSLQLPYAGGGRSGCTCYSGLRPNPPHMFFCKRMQLLFQIACGQLV